MFSQDIFVSLSQVDGLYFVCNIDDFKFLADMIQHIPLNLRSRYVFCTAPLNRKEPFVCTTLLKVSYFFFFQKMSCLYSSKWVLVHWDCSCSIYCGFCNWIIWEHSKSAHKLWYKRAGDVYIKKVVFKNYILHRFCWPKLLTSENWFLFCDVN